MTIQIQASGSISKGAFRSKVTRHRAFRWVNKFSIGIYGNTDVNVSALRTIPSRAFVTLKETATMAMVGQGKENNALKRYNVMACVHAAV